MATVVYFLKSFNVSHEVDITNSNLFENNETEQFLKILRNDNSSNLNFCYLPSRHLPAQS